MKKKQKKTINNILISSFIILLLLITLFGIFIGFDKENLGIFGDVIPECLSLSFNNNTQNTIMAEINNEDFKGLFEKDIKNLDYDDVKEINLSYIQTYANSAFLSITLKENISSFKKKITLLKIKKDLSRKWYMENVNFCVYFYDI